MLALLVGAAAALRLVQTVGGYGSALGRFDGPRHIAALPGGGVCVVDGMNERVQVIDAEARCVRSVDGLVAPTGVAFERDTLWWAESTGRHRVRRLRLSARSVATAARSGVGRRRVDVGRPWAHAATSAGGLGDGDGELHDPQCLAVAGELLLVAEWGNHRVSVFDKTSLAFVRHIGGGDDEWYDGGDGDGELDQPCGVSALGGEVFVADTWNHRISVFDLESGAWLRSFGTRGAEPGQFNYPTAVVAAGPADGARGGRLYVTERTGMRVQVLTLDGAPLRSLDAPCGGWLYGVCAQGERVWLTSSNKHVLHLLANDG